MADRGIVVNELPVILNAVALFLQGFVERENLPFIVYQELVRGARSFHRITQNDDDLRIAQVFFDDRNTFLVKVNSVSTGFADRLRAVSILKQLYIVVVFFDVPFFDLAVTRRSEEHT